ncbi:hypothetical protein BC834DRAFT_591901 [Gloeopeniophorella convolvens]|nr:hypothetical protein BC834DRAFT_591901 [Gloeopeniophorella convolvens]
MRCDVAFSPLLYPRTKYTGCLSCLRRCRRACCSFPYWLLTGCVCSSMCSSIIRSAPVQRSLLCLRPSDVKDVGYVINYDFPNNCEDYIHRIGRTGVSLTSGLSSKCNPELLPLQRAGLKGTSYTYFTTENAKSARELVGILKEAKAEVPSALEEMSMFVVIASSSVLRAPQFRSAIGTSKPAGRRLEHPLLARLLPTLHALDSCSVHSLCAHRHLRICYV